MPWCEGTGEANRAVEAVRGTRGLLDRPLKEPGEEDVGTGTGRGLEEDDSPFWEFDMMSGSDIELDGGLVLSHCPRQLPRLIWKK